jgi:small subunit ribosomal protein S20
MPESSASNPIERPRAYLIDHNPVPRALLHLLQLCSELPLTSGVITLPFPARIEFMPNTKSAERRARNSARKHLRNHGLKARLKSLEKSYLGLLAAGNRDQATTSYRAVSSALDKAAKTGVIHKATADRKKSRLAIRLNTAKSAPAAAPASAPNA